MTVHFMRRSSMFSALRTLQCQVLRSCRDTRISQRFIYSLPSRCRPASSSVPFWWPALRLVLSLPVPMWKDSLIITSKVCLSDVSSVSRSSVVDEPLHPLVLEWIESRKMESKSGIRERQVGCKTMRGLNTHSYLRE